MAVFRDGHKHSRRAAFFVSVMSVLFVIGLLIYLFYSAHLQAEQFARISEDAIPDTSEGMPPALLEKEYQQMKAMRFGYALIYRFSLSAAAIVVSLATIVLGSVLIFDRVVSATESGAAIANADEPIIWAHSPFPGLIMVFLGSVTLSLSIYFAGPGAPMIKVVDVPVFVEDPNFARNARLGVTSSLTINAPKEEAEAQGELIPGFIEEAGND